MEASGYLLMAFGLISILIWIGSSVSRSQRLKEIEKKQETEIKILLQPFILTTLKIFPEAKITLLNDRGALLKSPLYNQNRKKVGVVEISGDRRSGSASYLLKVTVLIDDKRFEEREYYVKPTIVSETLEKLAHLVLTNQDLQKRILATTY